MSLIFAAPRIDPVMDLDGVNPELFFVTEVLGLRSLHYGYWDEPPATLDGSLSLSGISAAQLRFTQQVLRTIPADVRRVLDVGCGIGDIARAMAERGLSVTALSPDKNHQKYFEGDVSDNVAFCASTFEAFDVDDVFDLILMSESQNYFDADIGLRQSRRYLRPGGYILIAGMFRRQRTPALGVLHSKSEYWDAAARHGFSLLNERDITTNVLPTMQFVNMVRARHLEPAFALAHRYLRASMPVKLRLMKLLFRRQINELRDMKAYYEARTDPEVFARDLQYVIALFQAHSEPATSPASGGAPPS
jgi:SAM-dependent methyltransferase